MTTPAGLLAARLRADPARPFLTFYDDATGERVELSAATFANWVAKTANLLQDDLCVEAGARVGVLLPAHWQTAVVLIACWSVGAAVAFTADGVDTAFVAEERLGDAAGVGDVVGLSLRPMGARLAAPAPGVVDYAADVLAHGDAFTAYAPVTADSPALELDERAWSAGEVAALTVPEGSRVLSTLPYDTVAGLQCGLVGPLAAGSVVLCRNLAADALAARTGAERVTHTAGVALAGLPRLA